MSSIKGFIQLLIAMSLVLYIAITSTLSTAVQAPFKRLDDVARQRGHDPEAGFTTMEVVIFAAIVLVVVVAVATGFTEKIQTWFDRVPGGE